jgi:hypothetical protein
MLYSEIIAVYTENVNPLSIKSGTVKQSLCKPWMHRGGVEVQLYSFFISIIVVGLTPRLLLSPLAIV